VLGKGWQIDLSLLLEPATATKKKKKGRGEIERVGGDHQFTNNAPLFDKAQKQSEMG
jgi:hypothetical protein